MAKPRPATWLEKEMIYDAVKNSSEELPVDLKQCDFSRSGAGNLVCRFDGQQIFYLTKGGNLVVTSRELKAQKTRQKFEREKATKTRSKNKKTAKKERKKRTAGNTEKETDRTEPAECCKARAVDKDC